MIKNENEITNEIKALRIFKNDLNLLSFLEIYLKTLLLSAGYISFGTTNNAGTDTVLCRSICSC